MYFGLSFSRVGCDFRVPMIPIFTKAIFNKFERRIFEATRAFETNMEKFTLINKSHPAVPWKSKNSDPIHPPDSLLEFYPLAEYLNQVLTALNELKLCAPISLIKGVFSTFNDSLVVVAKGILVLYGQEQQAFSSNSREAFTRLCTSFADDLVPYVQKCLSVIFPLSSVASHIGVSVQYLQQEKVGHLDKNSVIEPIRHLLPARIEPVLNRQVQSKEIGTEENMGAAAVLEVDTENTDTEQE